MNRDNNRGNIQRSYSRDRKSYNNEDSEQKSNRNNDYSNIADRKKETVLFPGKEIITIIIDIENNGIIQTVTNEIQDLNIEMVYHQDTDVLDLEHLIYIK